jgi:serine/threonine-protein kinase HipA
MNSINVHVNFGDRDIRVGELYLSSDTGRHVFSYDPRFISSGLEISPLRLPIGGQPFHAPQDANIYGLHGVFADSLPDNWGRMVQDAEFLKIGIDQPTALERLAFIGQNGIGALNYRPAKKFPKGIDITELAALRKAAQNIIEGSADEISHELLKSGGSAGGARPKFLVDIHEKNHGQIRYTHKSYSGGYIPVVLKVPTFRHDHYQKIEYAYSQIAQKAGLNIPDTYLIKGEKSGLAFFAVKRFDILPDGSKLHVHSLAGLHNINFNDVNTDATAFLNTVGNVTRNHRQVVEAYKIIAFNHIGFNNDDHSKNFSFTMDKKGEWSLAPAYDISYSKGQNGLHYMKLNGKTRNAETKDFKSAAKTFNIENWENILENIIAQFLKWPQTAKECEIPRKYISIIDDRLKENIKRVEKGLKAKNYSRSTLK